MSKQEKKALVPAMRFPEFRDAGEWNLCKIGDFIKSHKAGASLTPKDFVDRSDFEVIPKKAISEGSWLKIDPGQSTFCTKKFFDNNSQSVIDNTFLITTLRDLVPSGPSIGYIVKYGGTKKYMLAQGVYGLKPKANFCSDFLIHFSNTTRYRKLVNSIMVGSTQVHIRSGEFLNLPFKVPAKAEQQKIADCLTSIDELITAQTRKLHGLKAHKKGLMQQLFPAEGETLPKLRFPEFRDKGGWEIKPLGKVGENLDSRRVPITGSDRVKGNVPYYGASGIIDYVQNFIFDEDLLCISEDGANLVARTYPIAFSISGKTWVNNHAHVLKFEHAFTQVLVENYLNSINFEDYLTGMAQPKLNRAKLDTIPIPLPEPEEQKIIADCLSSIDELITAQTQKIEALKDHKKGLMQQLFPAMDEVAL